MVARRLLIGSFALLLLILVFVLAPVRFAHADECNLSCGQDPVQAGCTAAQYIVTSKDFTAQKETWEIRLRSSHVQSSACINKVWASLVIIPERNATLYNSKDIQVNTTFQYDSLPSTQFGSGAYTNMIPFSNGSACVNYDGNGISPGICADHL